MRSIAASSEDQSLALLFSQEALAVPTPILQTDEEELPPPELGVGVGVGDVPGVDGEPPPPHDGITNTAAPKATRAKG
ncbi:MAG: hypothetical protein U0599_00575 [Vicinamibacteria bacterium]